MKTSIFTPSNDLTNLNQAYDSFKHQDFFEWVLVLNNCNVPKDFKKYPFIKDARVKIFSLPETGEDYNIGFLKKYACEKCSGNLLLELDHDDLLMPTTIERIENSFRENPSVGFVYSNAANFFGNFEKADRYKESLGWKYRPIENNLEEHVGWPAVPANLARIWFAPNHIRVWRSDVYRSIGGHDITMKVLDDLDLVIRTYLVTDFLHVDECLYLYRIGKNNNWKKYSGKIQKMTPELYKKYFRKIVVRWAEKNKHRLIDLGGRFNSPSEYESVDLKNADVTCDLREKWPFEDNSIGVIRAHDIMGHIEKIHFIKEAYRVLVPGGYLLSKTLSTDGRGAFQDPTQISFYNENSFAYYVNKKLKKYIDISINFQSLNLHTTKKNKKKIRWVKVDLVAIKDGMEKIPKVNIA